MAAKSIVNELYQRLRTAAPIYKTQTDGTDRFLCTLTLPAVESEWEALAVDRHFEGRGSSKKEAEHAAAIAAVELLTAEKVLRPDTPAPPSHVTGSLSPSLSSATSGVSLPGVGSKRSQSNTDLLDDDTADSLELRILEALSSAYPKPLNGAQLAKLCGHFKLKSKVNHLLYMKLKAQGLVELLDTHPPSWRAAACRLPACSQPASAAPGDTAAANAAAAASSSEAGSAGASTAAAKAVRPSTAAAAAPAGGPAVCTASPSWTTREAPGSELLGEVSSSAARCSRAVSSAAVGVASAAGDSSLGPRCQRQSCQAGLQVEQEPAVSHKAATASPTVSSRGVRLTGGSAGGGAAAAAAAGGGGMRGSCSPVPPAVYSRKHQQQGPRSGGVQPCSNGATAGAAAQSDIAMYRRQHVQRRLQQQNAGPPHNSQHVAAWSPAAMKCHSRNLPQQHQQNLLTSWAAAGPEAAASVPAPVQQQQGKEALQAPAGLDAVLLPQTLAAVAGLGLLDLTEAGLLPAAGAAGGTKEVLARPGHHQQHTAVDPTTQVHSANSYGRTCSRSCSQELHSFGPAACHSHSNAASQQLRGAAAAGTTTSGMHRQVVPASDSDDDVSPAVLAAANEAASLEPAPFDAQRLSGGSAGIQQQQQQQVPEIAGEYEAKHSAAGGVLLQHVDLLAAMHINERPAAVGVDGPQGQALSVLDAVVPDSTMVARNHSTSSKPVIEAAGTKRKYPVYLSTEGQAAGSSPAGGATGAAAEFVGGADVHVHEAAQQGRECTMQDAQHLHHKQAQHLQQQDGQPSQQHSQPDADLMHPQRRRRRSGQGEVFSGRGLGLSSAALVTARQAAVAAGVAAYPAGDDDCTGSSEDMQDSDEAAVAAGSGDGDSPAMPQQQQQQQGCQQAQQQEAGAGQPLQGVPWQQTPPLIGASWPMFGNGGGPGNLWHWQGGHHQGLMWQPAGQGARQPPVAADSEGNGSCVGLAASGGTSRAWDIPHPLSHVQQQQLHLLGSAGGTLQQQRQQQPQPTSSQGWGAFRASSPGPCMSGLSVGASAVSGGNRGSVEPMQPAAAGQEVTQPPQQLASQHEGPQLQQQQPDWEQSEEQALQLLSRLALPRASGGLPAAGAAAPTARQAGILNGQMQAWASGTAAAGPASTRLAGSSGAIAGSCAPGTSAPAAACTQVPSGGPAVQGDCLSVAMAAASAAAQAAAAVASAAGLMAAEPQRSRAAAAGTADERQSAAAAASLSAGGMLSGMQAKEGVVGGAAAAHAAGDCAPCTRAADAGGPADLQAEYERRVGAVRNLVQQLNEALQGLSSLQEQVSRPSDGG